MIAFFHQDDTTIFIEIFDSYKMTPMRLNPI